MHGISSFNEIIINCYLQHKNKYKEPIIMPQ